MKVEIVECWCTAREPPGPRARRAGASQDLSAVGQPVLVPGDMGRASWVLVGTEERLRVFFELLSRCGTDDFRVRRRSGTARDVRLPTSSRQRGIIARAEKLRTLVEEMPEAYKRCRSCRRRGSGSGALSTCRSNDSISV